MTPSLFIAIACHNRKRVAELCLPTMVAHPDDHLALYNDGSAEYGADWLLQFHPSEVFNCPVAIGIQAQRRMHMRHFLEGAWTHLYFSDHDCVMDPLWRSEALALQAKYGAPLCLYNTLAHSQMPGNTLSTEDDVIWRRVAPGVSYLLTRAHVERVRPFIDDMEHFDWQIPALLGHRFAVSRTSYVDHIGWGGIRHPAGAGPDEGDRATNPTHYLQQKRAEIVEALSR